jgi:putative FmdB family regulatory protein
MPTYTYHCDACNSEFEKEQRIVEPPLKKCAKCGKPKARRLITGANFILKGGGWYSDGYGSSKASSASSADGTSKSSSSTSETKTEKKSGASGEVSKPAQSSSSD